MSDKTDKVSASLIKQALENAYHEPEWYLGYEVGNSTGADCKRYADAVAVNAYPSKGYETRGFEIKVSKQDIAAELQNGIKSDEIARFCDYWFLVVPKGLSDDFTLPPTWGVLEYSGGKLSRKTTAKKLAKAAPTAGFLCAMLRGRERVINDAAKRITASREEQIKQETLSRAGHAENELKKMHEKLAEIKEATGIALDNWSPTQPIIDRLKAAKSLEIITRNIRAIEYTANTLTKGTQEIQTAIDAIRAGAGKEANA
jgi:hypothetical protein